MLISYQATALLGTLIRNSAALRLYVWETASRGNPSQTRESHMHLSPELGQRGSGSIPPKGIYCPTNNIQPRAPLRAGAGRCGVSGCNCPEYSGSGQLCANCGHNWSAHW